MGNEPSEAEAFLDHVSELLGEPTEIRKVDTGKGPPVHAIFFKDLPEEGMTTSVTYGLSLGNHADWKIGRPELLVCVNSTLVDYGLCAAYFANEYRNELPFQFGSLFMLDTPICDESDMAGFVIFGNPLLEPEDARVEVGRLPVNIVGAYPIHAGEAELIQRKGFEKFWREGDWDPLDVHREDRSSHDRD